MSSEKLQGKLERLSLVCKIASGGTSPGTPAAVSGKSLSSKKTKGTVAARADGKMLVLSNEQTKTDIIRLGSPLSHISYRYDCFDAVYGPDSGLANILKDASAAKEAPQDSAVILLGSQGSPKTRELFSSSAETGEYGPNNAINAVISGLLQGKSGVAISLAEVVASPEQNGEVALALQDLLSPPNDAAETKKDELTSVQIS